MNVRALSARMSDWLGRKLLPSGVSKLENNTRRVDAGDLVALALALDVTPNRLLFGPNADDSEISLAPNVAATTRQAWTWANGVAPLTYEPRSHDDRQMKTRFRADNNPLVEPELTAREGGPHWEDLTRIAGVLEAFCRRTEISPGRVVPILQWMVESMLRERAADGER